MTRNRHGVDHRSHDLSHRTAASESESLSRCQSHRRADAGTETPAESGQTGGDPLCGPGSVTAMIMTIMGEIRRRRRPTRKVTAGRHARRHWQSESVTP